MTKFWLIYRFYERSYHNSNFIQIWPKTRFFYEGWSWFKFNNLRMALDMALKFYSCVEKRLKLKVQSVEETRRFPPPHLPSWIVLKAHWNFFAQWKPLPPPLYEEIWSGTLNQLFLPTGEQGKGNRTVELACLEMLNIGFLKIFIYLFTLFKVRIILVLTNKNQPPN